MILRSFGDAVVRFRLDGRDLGQNGIDIDILPAFGPLVQIAFGIQGGQLLGECAANELIDRDALVQREALGVKVNGVGKSNAQGAHACDRQSQRRWDEKRAKNSAVIAAARSNVFDPPIRK
jgi:hypothetical protein